MKRRDKNGDAVPRRPSQSPYFTQAVRPRPIAEASKSPSTSPIAEASKSPLTSPTAEASKSPLTPPIAEATKSPLTSPIAEASKSPLISPTAEASKSPSFPQPGASQRRDANRLDVAVVFQQRSDFVRRRAAGERVVDEQNSLSLQAIERAVRLPDLQVESARDVISARLPIDRRLRRRRANPANRLRPTRNAQLPRQRRR